MLEIFLLILISGILLLILGVSATTLLYIFLCIMELLFILCTFFFMTSLFFLLVSKRKDALCTGISDKSGFDRHVCYEIDGVSCRNLFPTDALSKKMIKIGQLTKVSVTYIGRKKKLIILDNPSIFTIGVGFPIFLIMTAFLGYILLFL